METQHTQIIEQSAIDGTYVRESVSFAQMDAGHFDVGFAVLDCGPLEISRRDFNLGFTAAADVAPHKCMFGLIADPRTQSRWFGADVDEAAIPSSRTTIELSTTGPGSFYTLSVDEKALQRQFPNAPDALALLENIRYVEFSQDPINVARLRTVLDTLFATNVNPSSSNARSIPLRSIYGTIIPLASSALADFDDHSVEATIRLTKRLRAVHICEAYFQEYHNAAITLLDLSQVSGMRSRSLINAFQAVTGYSPMAYLKRLRLNGAHRDLQSADKSKTHVIDVATAWGFLHMGHFSVDYRAMFGETPSQTLFNS